MIPATHEKTDRIQTVLADFIEDSIPTELPPILRAEMRSELQSHLEMKLRDLALEGVNYERSVALIISSFGSPRMIKEQLRQVYWVSSWSGKTGEMLWVIPVYYVAQFILGVAVRPGMLGGSVWVEGVLNVMYPLMTVAVFIVPSFWVCILVSAVVGIFLRKFVYFAFPGEECGRRTLFAVAFSMASVWLSLLLSQNPDYTNPVIHSHAGFPLRAFLYSYSLPADTDQFLRFAVNYIFWLAIGIGIGFCFPRRVILSKYFPGVAWAITVACIVTGIINFLNLFD
jgi:hypothetical protein